MPNSEPDGEAECADRQIRARRLKAIGLICAAIGVFSVLDTCGKYLLENRGLPVFEVVWLRFLGHALISVVLYWPNTVARLCQTNKPGHQAMRSLFMLATTISNFAALRYLQLDQTVSIFFLAPLAVAALSGPLLGEWVGWRRFAAIATGFLGVLLIVRPGFGGIHWAVVFSFASMFAYALYSISTRYLAAYDPAEVTHLYSPIAGVIVLLPFALLDWVWPTAAIEWVLLAILGGTGALGHWLLILAHREAPAPILAPFVYVGLIWMTTLGYFVFGDIPSIWTLFGGGVVILSGLYLLYRERRTRRQ